MRGKPTDKDLEEIELFRKYLKGDMTKLEELKYDGFTDEEIQTIIQNEGLTQLNCDGCGELLNLWDMRNEKSGVILVEEHRCSYMIEKEEAMHEELHNQILNVHYLNGIKVIFDDDKDHLRKIALKSCKFCEGL